MFLIHENNVLEFILDFWKDIVNIGLQREILLLFKK